MERLEVWQEEYKLFGLSCSNTDAWVTGQNHNGILFLYCFQATGYAIWHERNTRRAGEAPQLPARLIIFLDKLIRNRISSLRKEAGSKYEKAMELCFESRRFFHFLFQFVYKFTTLHKEALGCTKVF